MSLMKTIKMPMQFYMLQNPLTDKFALMV